MNKIKSILLLLIGAVLALFLYENWVVAPHIKLFGKEIIQLNISLIIIIFLVFGFFLGIFSHFAWVQKRRKNTRLASGEQKAPESQSANQQEEKKQ
jgi:capsular polysaccharide biosynthesis protein